MFYLGRLISAFFNQFFRWLFWNKTGQKVLFTIVIFAIAVCFIKLGEVSAVEEVTDINYDIYSYYEGVVNDAISRLGRIYVSNPNAGLFNEIKQNNASFGFYFYWGSTNNGSNMANSRPSNKNRLVVIEYPSSNSYTKTATTDDYAAITGATLYSYSGNNIRYREIYQQFSGTDIISSFYIPNQLYLYKTTNWLKFEDYVRNGSISDVVNLLNEINESLTNTTPDQESEDSVIVDSSATDSVDTSEIDSVFSSAFTSFANKFTYYDLADADQWVITINGTRIVLKSDILYNMIKNTWFYPMLQLLWYYIFGHYAFVWLTNLIHKIKDGSILDGLEVNEVISKEML